MSDSNRNIIAALTLSAAGLVGIAVNEGYSTKAVPDPVKGTSVPTTGFGTTGGVRMGDTNTPVGALQRMLLDIKSFEGAVKQCVHVPLYQYEYDAFIDLSYNIGSSAFCGSTLVKRLNAKDYQGACDAILMWHMVGTTDCSAPGNKTCAGLWARRQQTRALCLGTQSP